MRAPRRFEKQTEPEKPGQAEHNEKSCARRFRVPDQRGSRQTKERLHSGETEKRIDVVVANGEPGRPKNGKVAEAEDNEQKVPLPQGKRSHSHPV